MRGGRRHSASAQTRRLVRVVALEVEEFDVDDVGVAADGAIFDVTLFGAGGGVEGDDDRLAAGGAGVGRFIAIAALTLACSFELFLSHLFLIMHGFG